jgi:hypothetical protein
MNPSAVLVILFSMSLLVTGDNFIERDKKEDEIGRTFFPRLSSLLLIDTKFWERRRKESICTMESNAKERRKAPCLSSLFFCPG